VKESVVTVVPIRGAVDRAAITEEHAVRIER
jgi:hypothetical protein